MRGNALGGGGISRAVGGGDERVHFLKRVSV